MNCTYAKELLPLFVTGDLSAADIDAVGEHVSRCDACRTQIAEIAAARDWLKQAANPALDEDFYDRIRGSVWNSIDADAGRPRWWTFPMPYWTSRPVMAMAAAVLLLVFGLIAIRRGAGTGIEPDAPQPVAAAVTIPGPETTIGGTAPKQEPQQKRIKQSNRTARALEIPVAPAHRSPLGDMAEAGSDTESIEESGMMRIEIQTADPNIKIIWLAPKQNAEKSDPVISTTE